MTAVAWVGGVAVDVAEVDRREGELRAGAVAGVLPRERTGEGRQLRRWLVQVLAAERLVAAEAEARGLSPADAPPLAEIAPDRAAMLGLGSVAADLLARDPLARAVFVAVTAEVTAGSVDDYYRRNPERFWVGEERVVRDASGRRRGLRRGEMVGVVEDAVFAAHVGETVSVRDPLGVHVLVVEEVRAARVIPLSEVRAVIAAQLLGGARRRAFTAWLDRLVAERVRLAAGYEHPGDPAQPDNTHRH